MFYKKIINIDESTIIKRSTIFNFIASLINASYSAVMLFFITRIIGVEAGGMFSIAIAYAYQCQTLGAFGVRNIQASDTNKQYNFSDYFYLRILSCIAMYGLIIYYSFASNYSIEKSLVVFSICIFKSVEAIEDLYHGEYHRQNRLDIGSLLQAIRYSISLIVLILLLFITHDLILSNLIVTILTIIIFVFQNKPFIKYYIREKIRFDFNKVKQLFFIALPVCFSGFISAYILNIPKYTIDQCLNQTYQTYYGILMMPVVVINMLSLVIYRPMINSLSYAYNNSDKIMFKKIIFKQIMIIVILTILAIVFGFVIGLKLLNFVYGVNLNKFILAFIILLIGGGLNTLAGFFTVVLTIQRKQNIMLFGYIFTLILSILISTSLVQNYEMVGASALYAVSSAWMAFIFFIMIFLKSIHLKEE